MKAFGWVKPEYIWQPRQVLRRVAVSAFPSTRAEETVELPWGLPIHVRPTEAIGRSIVRQHVFDLALTETLWRLADHGETVVDIGANIGYTASILAKRVVPGGTVWCFEPHPETFAWLTKNLAAWSNLLNPVTFEPRQIALAHRADTVTLEMPGGFEENWGSCRVVRENGQHDSVAVHSVIPVTACCLDALLPETCAVGVAKMDVEGFEPMVLAGAQRILKAGQVRDWVFEHHEAFPSPLTNMFEMNGYTVFQLYKGILKPNLVPIRGGPVRISSWESRNLLATKDAGRAIARFSQKGWLALRGRPPAGSRERRI
jgi:FkbM family methyltransferase